MKKISRRLFVEGTGAGIVAVTLPAEGQAQQAQAAPAAAASNAPKTTIQFTVNGQKRILEVEDRWTLVEVLRDHLQLTGTKIGCDRGECGACTVLVNGKAVYSCSQLAAWMDGKTIQTVEGLAKDGELHPLQRAFIDHGAFQCGFCTPGMIMASVSLLDEIPTPTEAQVREGLEGNLCRCTGYHNIVKSVLAAAAAK